MVNKEMKIIIDDAAKKLLSEAYQFIKKDSPQNAVKVKNKILDSFKLLAKHPERHPPDKYRNNNDGSFRAYEIYSYRISYHVSPSAIRILRIRHTRMNPLEY